jgi:hypothetical protein
MMSAMFWGHWRRAAVGAATAMTCLGVLATPAAGATLPPRAEVRVRGPLDVEAFERLVAKRYHVQFRKVVAADIDRDGDLDFVSATDVDLVVWMNDGQGRLTSQTPARPPMGAGSFSGAAWQDQSTRLDDPLPNAGPSTPLPGSYVHEPPPDCVRRSFSSDGIVPRRSSRCRTPRAPPA